MLTVADEQATLLRLTRGLAVRVEEGFRYVCPERWGGDATAPVAALPGGPAWVAGPELLLVEGDGSARSYAPELGQAIALASGDQAAFGIFQPAGRYELWRLTPEAPKLVAVLDDRFETLVAHDDEVALLGWNAGGLVVQRMSLAGEVLARSTWETPSVVAYAELRSAAGTLFVVSHGSTEPWVSLARIDEDDFVILREAGSTILGPVEVQGRRLLAVDGTLGWLEDASAIEPRGYVTCLGQVGAVSYLCVDGTMVQIVDAGLQTVPLFEPGRLLEPEYELLAEGARVDCARRWQDLKADLPPSTAVGARDAGGLGQEVVDASTGEATAPTGRASGCTSSAKPAPAGWSGWSALCALVARWTSRKRG